MLLGQWFFKGRNPDVPFQIDFPPQEMARAGHALLAGALRGSPVISLKSPYYSLNPTYSCT